MSQFIISLDFELFWGVADSRTIESYGQNIAGGRQAIPRMLALFDRYAVRATWATVGMVMCRDYKEWMEIRPAALPGYHRRSCSTYTLGRLAREYPELFFARDLVNEVLANPNHELASHTYSHFYCGEPGVNPSDFEADLQCMNLIADEVGFRPKSLVFPRNQVRLEYVSKLAGAGLRAYRGNPHHWLYSDGHRPPAGAIGRGIRLLDSWLPLSGLHAIEPCTSFNVNDVPASLFLRPCAKSASPLDRLRAARITRAMTAAAKAGKSFHLWWHPHNFGKNIEANIAFLEGILRHFRELRDEFGMTSACMADAA